MRKGLKRGTHVYGPLLSRRLGVSLGVDLVSYKTCDYDCVYCQLGRTAVKTAVRRPFDSPSIILDELKRKLDSIEEPDYVTISGSGEPTLNSDLGLIMLGIKELTDVPLAILTNGSLLTDEDVAVACMLADLVVPSLDAGDEETFKRVNRPAGGLTLGCIVDGMVSFRAKHPGQVWLEVMLVSGINTRDEQIEEICDLAGRINPDLVQLNTVVRPPAEAGARPVDEGTLARIAALCGAKVEVVSSSRGSGAAIGMEADTEEILGLLARRPCTAGEISDALSLHPTIAVKVLAELVGKGVLYLKSTDSGEYYHLT